MGRRDRQCPLIVHHGVVRVNATGRSVRVPRRSKRDVYKGDYGKHVGAKTIEVKA